MTETLLALTTDLVPPKKFTVNGDEYQLLSIDHLSSDQEATAAALFARYEFLGQTLAGTPNSTKGTGVALQMQDTRRRILGLFSNLPKEIIAKLPLSQQAALLEAVESEYERGTQEAGSAEAGSGSDDDFAE